jgi:hypothetical protein
MNLTKLQWWERFQKYYAEFSEILIIDLSRMNVDDYIQQVHNGLNDYFATFILSAKRSILNQLGQSRKPSSLDIFERILFSTYGIGRKLQA